MMRTNTGLILACRLAAVAVACFGSTSLHAASICNGVVKINNDFYLSSEAGAIVSRYTTDGVPKSGPAVSPDGTRIAYMMDESQQIVGVANNAGQLSQYRLKSSTTEFSGTGAIQSLRWASSTWLQVERHASPSTSRFDHYEIPAVTAATPTDLQPVRDPLAANACSIARITNYPACVIGSTVHVVNDDVYARPAYAGATPVQSQSISVGSVGTFTGELEISVKPTNVFGGITLEVTYGGGITKARIPYGGSMPIRFEDTLYALVPTVVSNKVRIDVVKSPLESTQAGLEPVIAWRGSDIQIFIVERNAAGRRLSMLEYTSLNPPTWDSSASVDLPVYEKILEFRFVSPTLALFRTENEYLLLPVSVTKTSSATTLTVGSVGALPESVGVQLLPNTPAIPADFQDWTCSSH